MKSQQNLMEKRAKVLSSLNDYAGALSGNLSIVSTPPGSKNTYGRLTWKEKQKTKILYIRKEEIAQVKKAVTDLTRLKAQIRELCDINRNLLLHKRRGS
jgi:hypothetical protein